MKYISTRDTNDTLREFSFIDAVLEGLAPDGGLLVPQSVPTVSIDQQAHWKTLSYQSLCFEVIRLFAPVSEVPDEDLHRMISAAYSSFADPDVVAPTVSVGPIEVMELFHGPTFAFKDVALQLLGQLFDFCLRARNARMTILGATSGDTGSAAIAGVKGRSNIDCVILFPLGKTSHVQELQMTTNLDSNIHCLAVKNSVFDDCQNIVKSCFGDAQFNKRMSLGAVNSINWARILAQIVYYVHASLHGETTFVVPTGNFGNVLAGYYAKQMGLPIPHLVIASNTNDILPQFFATGVYRTSNMVVPTMSPSMDIAISSNFERFLFDLFRRDGMRTKSMFDRLKSVGHFEVTNEELMKCRNIFSAVSVNEDKTLGTIANVFEKHGYLLCPHSAVGFAAAEAYLVKYPNQRVVTLATAHIGKFTEHILANIQYGTNKEKSERFRTAVVNSVPEKLRLLEKSETRRIDIDNSVEDIKEFLIKHVVH